VTARGVPGAHYLGGLDGLRGVACLSVLTAHCWGHFAPDTTPGGVAQVLSQGLVVFFAMSGLLIYLPFVRDIAAGERRVSVAGYTRRRLARVYPAYLVIFLLSNFVLQAVYRTNAVDTATPGSDIGSGMMTDPLKLVLNLGLFQTFFPDTIQTGINPAWSLTTELCFYAVLPLLAIPLVRYVRGSSRRAFVLAMLPALLLLAVGLGGRAWAEHLYRGRPALGAFGAEFGANGVAVLSRSLLALADNFAFGMVVAVIFVWMERGAFARWSRGSVVVVGTAVVAVGGGLGLLVHDSHPWFMGSFIALASAAVLLLIVEPSARGEQSALVHWASFRPIEYVGEISLSVYLWHYPMILLASRWNLIGHDSVLTMAWSPVLIGIASIGLGTLTYRFVEKPAMAGRTASMRRA
jgi:peptidoglycan/LPS O-acetylase OafA/YrhL